MLQVQRKFASKRLGNPTGVMCSVTIEEVDEDEPNNATSHGGAKGNLDERRMLEIADDADDWSLIHDKACDSCTSISISTRIFFVD